MVLEFKSYDGSYPNLCSGKLIMTLDGKEVIFPDYCLSSGGSAWTEDYGPPEEGEWTIEEWPKGFPEVLRKYANYLVNDFIPLGCCGGCL